jgi:hypothetical protein
MVVAGLAPAMPTILRSKSKNETHPMRMVVAYQPCICYNGINWDRGKPWNFS